MQAVIGCIEKKCAAKTFIIADFKCLKMERTKGETGDGLAGIFGVESEGNESFI